MPSAFAFSHRIEVRFRDCDPMGHVNHAVYLTYLEQCRFAYWRHLTGAQAAMGRTTSAETILVWLVGSPCREEQPAGKIPTEMHRAAATLGFQLGMQRIPGTDFRKRFLAARAAHKEPDILAFSNMAII